MNTGPFGVDQTSYGPKGRYASHLCDKDDSQFSQAQTTPKVKTYRGSGQDRIDGNTMQRSSARQAGDEGETRPLLSGRQREEDEREDVGAGTKLGDGPARLPWWKRPSPYWFVPGYLLLSSSMGMTIAPKMEVYTQLVCREIATSSSSPSPSSPSSPSPSDNPLLILPPHPNPNPAATANSTESANHLSQSSPLPAASIPPYLHFLPLSYPPSSPPSPPPPPPSSTTKTPFSPTSFPDINLGTGPGGAGLNVTACRRDPRVQGAVAELNVALTITMGFLSALTAGYWGGISDRKGRRLVVSLSLFGFIVNDVVLLVTFLFPNVIGYRFLVVGPAVEGLLGGMATASASINAYVSDTTPIGSRANIFSVFQGLMFSGLAIGPILGSLLYSVTGVILIPFWISFSFHVLHALLVVLVLPESLSEDRRRESEKRYREERERDAEVEARSGGDSWVTGRWWLRKARRSVGFLRPLGMLLPQKHHLRETSDVDPDLTLKDGALDEGGVGGGGGGAVRGSGVGRSKEGKWDWNLTWVALAYGCYVMMIGIYTIKVQYAQFKFNWGPVELGYFFSLMGVSRATSLLLIIPLFIRLVRPKPVPTPPSTRSSSDEGSSRAFENFVSEETIEGGPDEAELERRMRHVKLIKDSRFDLFLARTSILIDGMVYILLISSPSSPVFLSTAVIGSLAGGASPAMQSLALTLTPSPSQDAGKLLASLSVLSSIMTSIVGPVLFGVIYRFSVDWFAEMVFAVGAGVFFLGFLVLLLVRLKKPEDAHHLRGRQVPSGADDADDALSPRCRDGEGVRPASKPRSSTGGSSSDLVERDSGFYS